MRVFVGVPLLEVGRDLHVPAHLTKDWGDAPITIKVEIEGIWIGPEENLDSKQWGAGGG